MIEATPVTLVTGNTAWVRETAIAKMIAAADAAVIKNANQGVAPTAVILEGMPSGVDSFATFVDTESSLSIVRIAPGCPCCIGNLTMRVTLNRLLRRSPRSLYISLATPTHLDNIRAFLMNEPYDKLLAQIKDIHV